MKSNSDDPTTPLQLPKEWDQLPRMSFTGAQAPSASLTGDTGIAFDVRTAEKLVAAFQLRERRLKK